MKPSTAVTQHSDSLTRACVRRHLAGGAKPLGRVHRGAVSRGLSPMRSVAMAARLPRQPEELCKPWGMVTQRCSVPRPSLDLELADRLLTRIPLLQRHLAEFVELAGVKQLLKLSPVLRELKE